MNKKYQAFFILVILVGTAYSQNFTKNTKIIGGDIRVEFSKRNTDQTTKSRSLAINPAYGVFVNENLVFGLGFRVSRSFFEISLDSRDFVLENTSWNYSLTPFSRYYLSNNIFLQVKPSYGFRDGKRIETDNGLRTEFDFSSVTEYSIDIGAGYNFFLTDNLAIEGLISYQYSDSKTEITAENGTQHDIFLTIGIQNFLR